jgi:hypothetical protein
LFFYLNTCASAEEKIPAFFTCSRPESCIETLLTHEKLWGNFYSNYLTGISLWKVKPNFKFSPLKKQGEQRLEQKDQKLIPVINLPPISDPYEVAITLNHEIVHFVHLHNNLKFFDETKKINGCLTRYQLLLLKDESSAFKEEINFWDQSPKWFKEHFNGQSFESRLIEKKTTYAEYYQILKEKMNKDVFFVEKRYVELGEYPECAKFFFKSTI